MTRYQHLADLLAQRIEAGLYQSGERLPSVRTLSDEHSVSISTVQQAYHLLEDRQLITPQPRSGYYVTPRKHTPPAPAISRPAQRPVEITQWGCVLDRLNEEPDNDAIPFGSGSPDMCQSTMAPLWKAMTRLMQAQDSRVLNYDPVYGSHALREQVARLTIDSGCHLNPADIIITHGCHEALMVAIRAACQEGDIVAVESPAFHGIMQKLRGSKIKVIEIPTDSSTGISVEALKLALEQWPIKAVMLVPNCNNPLGFIMPEQRKRELLSLAQCYDIAIIEDDVYGDLAFEYPRPITIKSLDTDGRVLLCSSFSKTVAPGLRVGWIAPGRYFDRVVYMKYTGTGASASHPQLAIAEFIKSGGYQTHLRRMRKYYQQNLEKFTCRVREYFPCGICVSRPQGGFMMWIELPEHFDSVRLSLELSEAKVQFVMGSPFSASGKYRNCLRLNYGLPYSDKADQALRKLAKAVECAMLECQLQVAEENRQSLMKAQKAAMALSCEVWKK